MNRFVFVLQWSCLSITNFAISKLQIIYCKPVSLWRIFTEKIYLVNLLKKYFNSLLVSLSSIVYEQMFSQYKF